MHVHLVGSLGLGSSTEAFQVAGDALKANLRRCPDGEVGGRRMWIGWQWPLLRASQLLDPFEGGWIPNVGVQSLQLKPDVTDAEIWFGELGYAREARLSYQELLQARQRGVLSGSTRFQVCLPTPAAVIGAFIVPRDIPRVLPIYEHAMIREVEQICAVIPHSDLAVQWDVCVEMIQWDGRFPHMAPPPDMERVFAGAFSRICAFIPPGVQLGFHLCYGDHDNKHIIEPFNLAKAVELANLIMANAGRPVHWIHVPVPIDRDDAAYFEPLRKLNRGPETELYLGLVHLKDGAVGALRRMTAARPFAGNFGIATECGLGRARTRDRAREIIRVHADVVQHS